MSTPQERVTDELVELQTKLGALQAFLPTAKCAALPANHQVLLRVQEHFMAGYAEVLHRRLILFAQDDLEAQRKAMERSS